MTESDINKDAQAGPTDEPNADAANENGAVNEEQAPDPAAEMARLEAEKADLTDRLLRVAADMDNLRRRTERDIADARKYAVSKFAGDVLVVGDNLQRTLEALPPEAREVKENGLAALVEGVEMTARELERVLERHGVKKVAAEGARFDPNLHQAMFEVPDSNVPAGTVTQVIQAGYMIGDRVLRAALVGVSKGGPQPATAPENQDAESEAARD